MRGRRHTSGPIPYGWDIDEERHLVPSTRPAGATGLTEADVVRDALRRLADGANPYGEAQRLNALGVPATTRYAGQAEPVRINRWRPSRVTRMAENPLHALLVGEDVMARVVAGLESRRLPPRDVQPYPLTGRITCGCGAPWHGDTGRHEVWEGGRRRYYACAARNAAAYPDRRCQARAIPADWLEDEVAAAPGGSVRIEQATSNGREIALVFITTEDGRSVVRPYLYSARSRD